MSNPSSDQTTTASKKRTHTMPEAFVNAYVGTDPDEEAQNWSKARKHIIGDVFAQSIVDGKRTFPRTGTTHEIGDKQVIMDNLSRLVTNLYKRTQGLGRGVQASLANQHTMLMEEVRARSAARSIWDAGGQSQMYTMVFAQSVHDSFRDARGKEEQSALPSSHLSPITPGDSIDTKQDRVSELMIHENDRLEAEVTKVAIWVHRQLPKRSTSSRSAKRTCRTSPMLQ